MGCFNVQGGISQLPIHYGDRIGAIFCKIDSSDNWAGYYELYPMCPIVYGTYDEYGGITPDKDSKIVKILEDFFQTKMDDVVSVFARLTTSYCDNEDFKIVHNLIDKRDWSNPRWEKDIKPDTDIDERRNMYISNNFCMVLEHEQIIRGIINEHDILTQQEFRYYIHKEPEWNELYDEQHKLITENGLDKMEKGDRGFYSTFFEIQKELDKSTLLFPVESVFTHHGPFKSGYMFDLFRNYPEMKHWIYDKSIKQEYVETLKFLDGLDATRLKMYINHEYGSQWQNTKGWNRLIEIYKEINDKQLKEEQDYE